MLDQTIKKTGCSLCPQAATEFELHGLQANVVHQVQVQAIAYWGQKRLKSPKAQLSFTTTSTGKPQSHGWTCVSYAGCLSLGSSSLRPVSSHKASRQSGEWTSRFGVRTGTLGGFENSPCTSPRRYNQAWSLEQYIPSSHSIFYAEYESFFWPA